MQHQKVSIYLAVALTITGFLYATHPAFAASTTPKPESSLRITPVIVTIDLRPGTTQTQEILLENLSDSPAPIRANLTDFTATGEDGGYTFPETKTNPLVSWTKISPEELIIPAHTKQKVILTISLPKIIPVGGYFGMLFFEPVPQQQSDKTQIVSRIGVLLLGNLGVQDKNGKKADILTFTLPLLQETPIAPFVLRMRNISLNHITAKPISTVISWSGQEQRQILEDKVIFPGKVRRWEGNLKLPDSLVGIYNVTMSISTGNGEKIREQRTIVVVPYKELLAIIILISIITLSLKYKTRIKSSLTILIRG